MLTRVLSITAAVLSLTAAAAVAEGLTDRLQATRMTVVKIDREAGKFMCAEHRRWEAVSKAGLSIVHPGDIVRVDRKDGRLPRITVVRRAPPTYRARRAAHELHVIVSCTAPGELVVWSHPPRHLARVARLELVDPRFERERRADPVPAGQEHLLAERVDVEAVTRPVGRRHRL